MVGRAFTPAAHYKNYFLKPRRCGGVKTPPYKPAATVGFPANPTRGKPLPGGIYASPTNTRYRVYGPGDA